MHDDYPDAEARAWMDAPLGPPRPFVMEAWPAGTRRRAVLLARRYQRLARHAWREHATVQTLAVRRIAALEAAIADALRYRAAGMYGEMCRALEATGVEARREGDE